MRLKFIRRIYNNNYYYCCYCCVFSQPFLLSGISTFVLNVTPMSLASSFRLQYFPFYVRYSKYSCRVLFLSEIFVLVGCGLSCWYFCVCADRWLGRCVLLCRPRLAVGIWHLLGSLYLSCWVGLASNLWCSLSFQFNILSSSAYEYDNYYYLSTLWSSRHRLWQRQLIILWTLCRSL